MNRILMTGRTTAKPELRYTQSGVGVVNFTLAVNRKFRNENGDFDADFISCVAFRKTAETIAEYIEKGDLLGVEGRIQTRNYENQNGQKVYVTEVVVDQIDFLQARKEKTNEFGNPVGTREVEEVEENPFKEFGKQIEIDDSDLPF